MENSSTFADFSKFFERLPKMYFSKLKTIYLVQGQFNESFISNKVKIIESINEIPKEDIHSFQNETMNNMNIPLILDELLNYFIRKDSWQVEGLFRKNGCCIQIQTLYDNVKNYDFSTLLEQDIHVVACVLKQYLQKLPHPIISSNKIFNPNVTIKEVLNDLSVTNLRVLYVLLGFISEVTKHCEHNKMTATNMAIVFGPCFVRIQQQSKTGLQDIALSVKFIARLLNQFTTLVPNFDFRIFLTEQVADKNTDLDTTHE